MRKLEEFVTFGFETTFTIPEWWNSKGFSSDWETEEKLELMKKMAEVLSYQLRVPYSESKDIYGATQFELAPHDEASRTSIPYKITAEPGSIEINTPAYLLNELNEGLKPLFQAAKEVGLVTYRSWWYGIKTGTGGGCHLNIGGRSQDKNIWKKNPKLILEYCKYYQNRPYLHYPFMGVDVGPGGNAQRMDEVENAQLSFEALKRSEEISFDSIESVYEFFKETPLVKTKHCAPTLRKIAAPDYLYESRAIEMIRDEKDAYHMALLHLRILGLLEKALKLGEHEPLPVYTENFSLGSNSHLDSSWSYCAFWSSFKEWCLKMDLDSKNYEWFFERQFPRLQGVSGGAQVPESFCLREGRRKRVYLAETEKTKLESGREIILNKKIDTRFKRLEVESLGEVLNLKIKSQIADKETDLVTSCELQPGSSLLFDYTSETGMKLIFECSSSKKMERAIFDVQSNLFCE